MSYDLHLRPPAKKYLPTAVVSERIVGLGNVDGDGVSFRYRNPVTGAACSFHIESDHVLAPLSLERPRFFGLETMLLVSRLAEALNFEIFDPQQDRKIEGEDLLDLWIARNEEAIRALKSELPFLDLEKSLYWWDWTRTREVRRKELAPVVVPQLLLLADESRRVRTAAVWSARMEKSFFFRKRYFPSPEVFPECDLLILTAGSETRYASRDEAVGQLGSTVHANNLEDAGRVYKELKSAQTGRLKEIGPDGFIDVLI